MIINYLALISALAISGVSGYFSIIGLTAIFAGAFWPVLIMGSVLELGKLVTASWLYRNWEIISGFVKIYLTVSVILLMFITSMGIFGFLSKAHIEQQLNASNGDQEQVEILDSKITYQQQQIEDVDKQVAQIDSNITKFTEKGQAKSSLAAIESQRKTRDALIAKKDGMIEKISELKTQKITIESRVKKIEAEVGPLKYIAAVIFDNPGTNQLEESVRIVIMMLVIVFDPLAIVLLIAANIGLTNSSKRGTKKQTRKVKPTIKKIKVTPKLPKANTIEIDKSQITNWYDKI